MKKNINFLSVLFLTLILFVGCQDSANDSQSVDSPVISVKISSLTDENNQESDIQSIIDLYLSVLTDGEEVQPIATWSNYDTLSTSSFKFEAEPGVYSFRLNGSYDGKPCSGIIENFEIKIGNNELSFEMKYRSSKKPDNADSNPDESGDDSVSDSAVNKLTFGVIISDDLNSDIEIDYSNDGLIYTFEVSSMEYSNYKWYVNNQLYETGSSSIEIPILIMDKDYNSIRFEGKKNGVLYSKTLYLSMPELPVLEAYVADLESLQLEEDTIYRLCIKDISPNFPAVGRFILNNPSCYFDLDLTACEYINELEKFFLAVDRTNIWNVPYFEEYAGLQVIGITFGDYDLEFYEDSLTDTNLFYLKTGDGIYWFDFNCYRGATNLRNFSVGDGVCYFASSIITYAYNFKNFTIGTASNFNDGIFSNCAPVSVIFKGGEIDLPPFFISNNGYLKRIIVESGSLYMSPNAFYGCTSLEYVDLSNCDIKEISEGTFYGAVNLKINIPATVERISPDAFSMSDNIIFNISEDNPYYVASEDRHSFVERN